MPPITTLPNSNKNNRTNTKPNNGLHCPLFILDVSFMKDFLAGRMLRNKLFNEIIRRKNEDLPFQVVTTQSAFLRAIYLTQRTTTFDNLRFIMELAKIYPSKANYKNEVEVQTELTKFKTLMSEGAL